MKLAIVGANGQVGTELCLLLRSQNIEVIPIVRNSIGASFLKQQKFDCRIADISKSEEAKQVLHDSDAVVIAAYMWPDIEFSVKQNKRINEDIVEHAIRFSKEKAKIIYFSSIRALSHKIDKTLHALELKPYYDKEKRRLEKVVLKVCRKEKKDGYVLRLGHVFGKNQGISKGIKEMISKKARIHLQGVQYKQSNVLHTVTLAEAIIRCITAGIKTGIYSMVNHPRWTWKEVFEYYAPPGAVVVIQGKKVKKSTFSKITKGILGKCAQYPMKHYLRLRKFLPKKLDQRLQYRYRLKKIATEIATLEEQNAPIYLVEFDQKPIPGPFIQGLKDTKALLKEWNEPNEIFLA